MAADVPVGTRRRWLRPGAVVPVGEHLWVLDQLHPVAAVLDARSGDVVDVVGWPEPSTTSEPHSRRVRAGDDGIWVQQPEGPVLFVRRGVGPRGYVSRGLTLAAVSAHGAWCAGMRALGATAGSAGRRRVERSELRLLDPNGRSRSVWVEGDARSVRTRAGDLFVGVSSLSASDPGRSDGADPVPPPTRWLRLRADDPVPERLSPSAHGCRPGEVPPRDPTPGADPRARAAESVLRHDGVDITEHAWPLVPRPSDAEDHAADCLARLDHLDRHWTGPDGRRRPLADGLSAPHVELDGDWPDTRLVVTFAWAGRPGLRLRRTIALYDELGRVVDPEYADITLREDLDTDRVPPASAAVSGVLDLEGHQDHRRVLTRRASAAAGPARGRRRRRGC